MGKRPHPDSDRNGATENRGLLPVGELLQLLLSDLDCRNIPYCVQRNYEGYPEVVTGDVDLEQIYNQGIKATLQDRELESRRRQRWQERFQWTLAVALVCLMLEPLVSERRPGEARHAG